MEEEEEDNNSSHPPPTSMEADHKSLRWDIHIPNSSIPLKPNDVPITLKDSDQTNGVIFDNGPVIIEGYRRVLQVDSRQEVESRLKQLDKKILLESIRDGV